MNLSDITSKGWILALFVRDDGERLLLGDGWFDFTESLQHFQPNNIANDVVELQGADGQLLAGQVRRSGAQQFNGYVGDNTVSQVEIESKRREFLQFFNTKHFFSVVYVFADGSAIVRKRGYLVEAANIPEMWQKFPEYHVALNFEDVNYYEYAENASGDEIFANRAEVDLVSVLSGGLVWDSDGAKADSDGLVWEQGGGSGPTNVNVVGISDAEPVWTVTGPATNPTLTNLTTGRSITWLGTVPNGQKLVVNMGNQTAELNGANVYAGITGDWVELRTGVNRLTYDASGGATLASVVEWNGVVG